MAPPNLIAPRHHTGRRRVVFDFTITRGKIVAIDLIGDPDRLRQLDVAVLKDVGTIDLDL